MTTKDEGELPGADRVFHGETRIGDLRGTVPQDEIPRSNGEIPETFGRYQVRGVLGEGAFAVVYLGHDSQLDREVAIKVPRVDVSAEKTKQKFLAEAQQLAQLRHPGIVAVHDVGVESGRCYIVSEYLRGLNLADWLEANQPTWQESLRIAIALARALAHAHARRTVHRDLKPENVILTEDGNPVIVDFGLSVSDMQAGSGGRGMVMGTPAYMAPEQTRGEGHRIDGRTDVHALGVILYEMLTGRMAFQAISVSELLRQVSEDDPQPPRQLVPGLPRELERICMKCMAKKASDRYTTASDVADDLARVLAETGQAGQTVATVDIPAVRPVAAKPAAPSAAEMPQRTSRTRQSFARRSRVAERRRVTVVHCGCDLYDSEEIVETLDPEEQDEVLLDFQQLCRETALEADGTVVQTTHNGLLICFGYPLAFEDSAPRAVRMGLLLLAEMAGFGERLKQQRGVSLSAVVAIHSDTAVVKTGEGEDDTLSIVGPILRVAEELEGLAEANTVVVSKEARGLLRGLFDCQSLGLHRIRGSKGRHEVFEVRGERVGRSRLADLDSVTPLVGRDQEVGLLQDRWEQAAEGMGQVVLLIGEAGLGKSRLVHVLKEHIRKRNSQEGDPVIEWRCAQHHQDSSLYPATEFFERMLAFGRADSGAARLDRLVTHLRDLNLDGDREIELAAGLLGLSVDTRYPSSTPTNPQLQKEKTLDLLLDWLREYSYKQPVLFVVEDLHWIDPTTIEFLEVLIEQGFNDRILTLLTFRPEFETPWKSKVHQTQIALNRLTRRQIGEMMTLKAEGTVIPQHVIDHVAERTDGVPLFVEEFTAMVLEAGTVVAEDGSSRISTSFPMHEIPATLQDLLMARLDRIDCDIEVVQLGAAIGREFTHDLLQVVSTLEEEELDEELSKLVEAGLLFQRGRSTQIRYVFKHHLVLDAAYQSMLKKQRQEAHQYIADALEGRFPETVSNQPELLAHHFTEANLPERAVPYWERAGERSVGRCAHIEAIRHLTRGLELLRTLPESMERNQRELQMEISLGVPLQSTKGYGAPEVEEAYARARELCHKMGGNTEQLFPVLYGLFRSQMLRGQYNTAEELGQRLLELADRAERPSFVVAANRALGSTRFYMGRHADATPHLDRVSTIEATQELRAEVYQYDVVDPWITSRSYRTWTLWLLGYPDEARAESLDVVATAECLDHPFSLALALSFGSWLHQFRGDVGLTRTTAQKALDLSREHGFNFWIGWAEVMLGWARSEAGRPEEAIEEIWKGLVDWRAQGSELGRTYFLALMAEACAKAGQPERGLKALEEAEEFARATSEAYWVAELHRLRGELSIQKNPDRIEEAQACLQRALDWARSQKARPLELRAAMSMARLWAKQGRPDDGRRLVADVYDRFTEGFDTRDLQQANALFEELE